MGVRLLFTIIVIVCNIISQTESLYFNKQPHIISPGELYGYLAAHTVM